MEAPNGSDSANGHSLNLPDSKSPTLALMHPTDEEKLSIWEKNGIMWKGALSLEAYLRREPHLASQEFTKDGGITYWVLVDTANKQRVILSSCETIRKKALVFKNGKMEETITHGIGSVFCPPECRKRGYAQRMMKEVAEALKTWQAPVGQQCGFSILFSDIGKSYYAVHGWEPFNSSHISLPPATSTSNEVLNGHCTPEARPLYASDLPELCAIDEQLVRETVNHTPKNKTFIALVPDHATISWHHAREEFVAQELHGKNPLIKGAIVGTEIGKRVWCYWTRVFSNPDPSAVEDNTLHVLRLVVEERGLFTWERASADEDLSAYIPAITALLKMAQQEAKEWNMNDVELWNPTDVTVKAVQTMAPVARIVHRDSESIASLMWYGERPQEGPVAEYVDWLGNEKYGWC